MTWDEELVVDLYRRGVSFVVIGSIAARWQGVPLDLTDVDIVIDNGVDNLARLSNALGELGFKRYGTRHTWRSKQGDTPERIGRQPTTVFVRGTDTHEEELDILTIMIGVGTYSDVMDASVVVSIGNVPIRVATVEAIRQSKEAANRPKDRDHLIEIYRWQASADHSPVMESDTTTPSMPRRRRGIGYKI